MKTLLSFFLLVNLTAVCFGQKQVTGVVTDGNDETIPGVKVSWGDDNYTQTDLSGTFNIVIPNDSDQVTVTFRHELYLPKTLKIYQDEDTVPVRMVEVVTELDKVTVTSHRYGRFSNYTEQSIVHPTDELMASANAFGDVLAGLVNSPGVQSHANDGRLMIQGGGPDENVYYIDGLILFNPYVESINAGNRFKCGWQLFEGTILQSGGWGASYGNALSGIVQMNTASTDPIRSLSAYVSQSNVGVQGQMGSERTVLTGELEYYNMRPYYDLIHSNAKWQRDYQQVKSEMSMMNRIGRKGQVKTILHYHHSTGAFTVPYSGYTWQYDKTEDDALANVAADIDLSDDWNLYAGANFAYIKQKSISCYVNGDSTDYHKINSHAKVELTRRGSAMNNLLGVENVLTDRDEQYHLWGDTTYRFTNNLLAAYDEVSINCIPRVDLNIGLRYEYSTLLRKGNIVPRLHLCYHTGEHSSLSLSSGLYHMMPQEELLRLDKDLKFRQSFNNALSYQWKQEGFLLHAEGYYKRYKQLETYTPDGRWYYNQIRNQGDGDVLGANIYVHGTAFQMLDYKVSYAYVDAKLRMGYMDRAVMPQYLSHNRLTFSTSTYVPWIKSLVAASWFIDDGATFYRFGRANESHHSPCRHQLDLSLNFIPTDHLELFLSCQNVYGRKNVYGYRYSAIDPNYREPVYTLDPRVYWLELSFTLIDKKDRIRYLRKKLEERLM